MFRMRNIAGAGIYGALPMLLWSEGVIVREAVLHE
jgi:hypothetical protein